MVSVFDKVHCLVPVDYASGSPVQNCVKSKYNCQIRNCSDYYQENFQGVFKTENCRQMGDAE